MTVGINSWVTLSQADSYFSTRLGASFWSQLTDPEKETLLITAFNWLLFDASFSLSPSTDNENVRVAQMEAAYFLNTYYLEYEQRAANIAGGVTSVFASKWSESYGTLQKPEMVICALQKAGAYLGAGTLISLED